MSIVRPLALMLGGAAAGVAAYDFIRGKTFPTLSVADIKGRGPARVESKEWVRKVLSMQPLRRPPIIITTVNQIDPMLKELKLEAYRSEIAALVKEVTERSANALAVHGTRHDYLVLPEYVHRAVVEHEIGHLRAKEEGKTGEPSLLTRLAAGVWKPSFRAAVMDPEESAWGYVKGKSSLREKALSSYERGFHERRSSLLGNLGAVLLLGGLLTPK